MSYLIRSLNTVALLGSSIHISFRKMDDLKVEITTYKKEPTFSIPVIDVPATSKNLKLLIEKHRFSVAEIQKILGMEIPNQFTPEKW